MHHPEFPVVTILSAVFLLFPLPWHWSAGNVSMLSMIFWLFLSNIIYAVDSIVWAGNVNEVAVLWCDITTKIIIGSNVALPAACLSICIHLEQLASVRQATQTQASKRRRQYFELGLCFGLPAFVMALHYTVQGHRFDIIEDFGCRPATYISWPSILLIWILPIILAVLTLGFAACAFMHFMRRRANFAHHLEGRSSLTTTRYMRLILMSIFEMAWGLAITCFALWFATLSYRPWTNWADVHSDWNRIDLYSIVFMPSFLLRDYIIVWWAVPISTWIFVLFFAFGHDAMEGYRAVGLWFQKHVLRRNVGKAGPTNSFSSKPSVR
ncbi:fungal pheromone STE3G-protein-coupled receptor [Artomyces pyxidatus]|uniref:Fungal pheromone STE3G-protein-coupled receptor n=1 Tax=Artomyces pyxidatus TaxID=48021 RepID=A0ACB8SU74_9AGAM|nr:fungal pheromone STE3G-protein-coupled receptor [Artomyces pyxidatus]